jgi:hypothetical protein
MTLAGDEARKHSMGPKKDNQTQKIKKKSFIRNSGRFSRVDLSPSQSLSPVREKSLE